METQMAGIVNRDWDRLLSKSHPADEVL